VLVSQTQHPRLCLPVPAPAALMRPQNEPGDRRPE
jgi:hypothetical protein